MGIMVLPTQAYSLRISKQPAAFSVLSFDGVEEISNTYQFVIEFTCARARIPIADSTASQTILTCCIALA